MTGGIYYQTPNAGQLAAIYKKDEIKKTEQVESTLEDVEKAIV